MVATATADTPAIAALKAEARTFQPVAATIDADVTVVLLGYDRMRNMDYVARAALHAASVQRVIVSNNNPAHRIREWVSVEDPRLTLIDQPVPKRCHERFEIARSAPGDVFVLIDDDVLLRPEQITKLIEHARQDPHVGHGVNGSEIVWSGQPGSLRSLYYASQELTVDCLHTVYAFHRRLLRGYFKNRELAIERGLEHVGICDDILLSYAGHGSPKIHDVGPYLVDPSWNSEDVAVFRQDHYGRARTQLLETFVMLDFEGQLPSRAPQT